MKRILPALTIIYLFCFLFIPPLQAQEKKTEKKIRIVRVDENGKKVVLDTVLTGDINLEDLDLPAGIKIHKMGDHSFYVKGDGAKTISVIIDEEGDISAEEGEDLFHIKKENVMVMKKGEDGHKVFVYTISEGDTVQKVARMYADKHKNIALVSAGHDEDIHIHEGKVFIKKGDEDAKAFIISVDESGKEKVKTIDIIKEGLDEDEKKIIIRSAGGEEIFKIKGDVVIKIQGDKIKVEKEEKSVKENKKIKK